MNDHFPDWLRPADPNPSHESLSARWGVVQTLARKRKREEWLDHARLFLGVAPVQSDYAERTYRAFKDADPTIPAEDYDFLLQTLVGAVIMEGLSKSAAHADPAALAIVCADCRGVGIRGPITAALATSQDHLRDRSRAVRDVKVTSKEIPEVTRTPERGKSTRPKVPVPGYQTLPGVSNSYLSTINENGEAVETALTAIATAIDHLRSEVDAVVNSANFSNRKTGREGDPRVPVLAEEVDLLWWVLGEFSDHAGVPIGELPPPLRAVYAGREMADRTTNTPGHVGAEGFLNRALGDAASESATIHDVVVAARGDERVLTSEHVELESAVGLMPLTYALALARRSPTAWAALVDEAPGPDTSTSFGVHDLATQIYNETLLARWTSP